MRFKKVQFVFAVVFLVFVIIFQRPGIVEFFRGWTLTFFKPAILTADAIKDGLSNAVEGAGNFWKAFSENKNMRRKVLQLESEISRLKEVERENVRYRKLLEFKSEFDMKSIAARVIARDPVLWRKMIMLDKGSVQGIRKDMAVVWYGNLVGRVFEVGPSTARVILLIDPDARVSAYTSESRSHGIIEGQGYSRLKMIYLELDSGVKLGEEVLSLGTGGMIPKGLRIGTIVSLARDPNGLHLLAEVEPAAKFGKVEEVLCIGSFPEN